MIKFSVIIPNYNHGQFLKNRIDSILNQTYEHFEVIILDDNSNDNSKQIIEEYRNQKSVSHIVYSGVNSGSPFKQWSKGIQLAKHDWIWIAESDDITSSSFLEEACKMIIQNDKTGFYFCNSSIENEDGTESTTSAFSEKLLLKSNWEKSYLGSGIDEINSGLKYFSNIPNSSAVVFKKEYLVDYIEHLKFFRYCGDWYLYICILQNCNIAYNYSVLNTFRRTLQSHSVRDKDKFKHVKKKELFRILNLLYKIPGVTDKKEMIYWFTKYHIGVGFKTDGVYSVFRIVYSYFTINFILTLRFLSQRIMIKFQKR